MTEYELGSWLSTLLQERDALLYDNVDAYKREYSDFRAPVCREDRQGLDDFLHKKIEDTDELFHIGPYQLTSWAQARRANQTALYPDREGTF